MLVIAEQFNPQDKEDKIELIKFLSSKKNYNEVFYDFEVV